MVHLPVGVVILLLSAFAHSWGGEFVHAALAVGAAFFLQAIKAPVILWLRVVEGYRGAWI